LERIASLTKEEARKKLEEKVKADVDERISAYFNDKVSSLEEKIKELEIESDKKLLRFKRVTRILRRMMIN